MTEKQEPTGAEQLRDLVAGNGSGRSADAMAGLAALAVEVGEIRGKLTDLDRGMGSLADRVGGLGGLAAEVAGLAKVVAQLEGSSSDEGPPRPVDWHHIPADDRQTELADLVSWVRDVLFVGWPSARVDIRPCWPRHVELVNALLWLRSAWQTAYDDPGGRPHHAADFHHWLTEVKTKAKEIHRWCPRPGQKEPHPVPLSARDDTPALAQATRDNALAYLHALTTQIRDTKLSEEHRQQAREEAARFSEAWKVTNDEFREFGRALTLSESREENALEDDGQDAVT